uniref:HNH endonuclease n=1 Tax=Heterorhabditis bacteriophora TaxID=37862 RepID=A0A1I7XAK0_HETBA
MAILLNVMIKAYLQLKNVKWKMARGSPSNDITKGKILPISDGRLNCTKIAKQIARSERAQGNEWEINHYYPTQHYMKDNNEE